MFFCSERIKTSLILLVLHQKKSRIWKKGTACTLPRWNLEWWVHRALKNTFGNLVCFLEIHFIQVMKVLVCIYLSRLMEGWIGNWNQLNWKTMPQNRRFEQLLDTKSWFAHNRTPYGTFSWDVAQNHTTCRVCKVPLRLKTMEVWQTPLSLCPSKSMERSDAKLG